MKKVLCYFSLLFLIACNNNEGGKTTSGDPKKIEQSKSGDMTSASTSTGCGNSLLFHEGVVVTSTTYNAANAVTNTSVATITKVFEEGGMSVAEMESKTKVAGGEEKTFKAAYKCDGQSLQIDLKSLLGEDKSGTTIEGSGFSFPMNLSEGQVLPDVNYTISMNQSGKNMRITSSMNNRKVIGKENVTIDAGTIECYKIAADMTVSTDIEGMDEKTKKMMDEMKSKMPKSSMVMWYAPAATVMKVEIYTGDKMMSRNAITSIKKP